MKIPLQTWYLLLWCWTNQVPVDQTKKLAKVSLSCVYTWFEKFRVNIPESTMFVRLSKEVLADEMYRCGKKKGIAIPAIKERGGRQFVYRVLPKPSVDRGDFLPLLHQHVEPGTTLVTDGGSIYKTIEKWWPVEHKSEFHSRKQFALTAEMESLWGNWTTFARRMYHHVTKEKYPEVFREFHARFSSPKMFESPLNYLQKAILPVPFD